MQEHARIQSHLKLSPPRLSKGVVSPKGVFSVVTTIQEKKEPLTAKVLDMARLVEYQTGSVVSRAIIHKKTGTITLFAFDEGQGLSEHTAPFDALVCLLDGEAEVIISGNAHVLKNGEMIIMPANEPHALKAVGPFKMMLVMIRG
jgi:quercetin dioxygenase-like cupin family protein